MDGHAPRLAPTLERAHGAARVAFRRGEGASVLASLYQQAPCRILFPTPEHGDPKLGVLLTTTGGLTGGDRLEIDVEVGADAASTVSTQAAEKIYRSTGPDCSVRVVLRAGEAAWLEWLMQETILFDGAKLARRTEAEIATTGRLLAVESLVFGRAAMGEEFRSGSVHDVWRVRRGGRVVWIDALRLDGDVASERRKPFGLAEAAGCATILYVGPDAVTHLPAARQAISEADLHGGATSFDGVLVARLLSDDAAALRAGVSHIVARLRNMIAGLPERMPRVWSC